MDVFALIKKVRKIEIKAKQKVQDIFSGAYHSAFKGRGMSFSETRSYQYGDDVRNIDWNVTARSHDPQVKIFEEERELTIFLLVDVSASTYFGNGILKSELIAELSAIIGFNAINNNDKVGAILFSSEIVKFIPASKGKKVILQIIREILNTENTLHKGTNITNALRFLTSVQKKRAICFLFSDFIDSDYQQALSLAANRHEIIPVRISDDVKGMIPDVGLLPMKDLESGKVIMVNTSDKSVQNYLIQKIEDRKKSFENAVAQARLKSIEIDSETDYIKSFINYFKDR